MKTATIERVTISDGPVWTSNAGIPYYGFQLWLDNGDQGDALGRTANEYVEGQTINYNVEQTQYGMRIKVQRQNAKRADTPSAAPSARNANASFALSYAKDIAVAIHGDTLSKALTTDEILAIAQKFKNWLDANG